MKLTSAIAALALATAPDVVAFSPSTFLTTTGRTTTNLFAHQPKDESPSIGNINKDNSNNPFVNFCATAAMTAMLWGSPALIAEQAFQHPTTSPVVQMLVDKSSSVANAKEMASGTGSRVNKDPESLLRLGLPIKNKEVSTDIMEQISDTAEVIASH